MEFLFPTTLRFHERQGDRLQSKMTLISHRRKHRSSRGGFAATGTRYLEGQSRRVTVSEKPVCVMSPKSTAIEEPPSTPLSWWLRALAPLSRETVSCNSQGCLRLASFSQAFTALPGATCSNVMSSRLPGEAKIYVQHRRTLAQGVR